MAKRRSSTFSHFVLWSSFSAEICSFYIRFKALYLRVGGQRSSRRVVGVHWRCPDAGLGRGAAENRHQRRAIVESLSRSVDPDWRTTCGLGAGGGGTGRGDTCYWRVVLTNGEGGAARKGGAPTRDLAYHGEAQVGRGGGTGDAEKSTCNFVLFMIRIYFVFYF